MCFQTHIKNSTHNTAAASLCPLTQRDSGRDGPAVNPERHPGQHDHQGGREVGLQQEEEDVTPQSEVDVQTVVPAWRQGRSKKR